MHDESMRAMGEFLGTLEFSGHYNILDVGSLRVGGDRSYVDLMPVHWNYTGLDIVAGPNVDVMPYAPYDYPFPVNKFDIIISGQAIEHVENPFRWAAELYRILKVGGLVCIVGPSTGPEHHRPDYWRILPDGMIALLRAGGFKDIVITPFNDRRWHTLRAVAQKGKT